MEELVKLVTQKTGISEAMARQAIEVVLGFLKQKLPAPIAQQIDSVIEGGDLAGGLDSLKKGLGGILGGD
jgi:hypothetical protein